MESALCGKLDGIQRRATKTIKGGEELTYMERLKRYKFVAWWSRDYCESLEVSGDRNAASGSLLLSEHGFVCVFVLKEKKNLFPSNILIWCNLPPVPVKTMEPGELGQIILSKNVALALL